MHDMMQQSICWQHRPARKKAACSPSDCTVTQWGRSNCQDVLRFSGCAVEGDWSNCRITDGICQFGRASVVSLVGILIRLQRFFQLSSFRSH